MVAKWFLLVCLSGVLSGRISAQDASEEWVLTFEDEFDGPKLDYSKWTPEDPWGVERNEELQGYVIQAFHQEEGILRIRCEKKPTFYDGKNGTTAPG
ncbi:MAG: hypothetical protein P1U81_13245 [Verrucomicrobiales bacterium]|nr:hypothetical protein [Verrucomicrobiales bacterium]